MAGGIGLAPLRPVIRQAVADRTRYGRVVVLIGARTPADLLYPGEYDGWRAAGVGVRSAVPVRTGDVVSLHWDWACDVLDTRRAAVLEHYTRSQLQVANRTLRRPVADLVLG